MTKLKDMFPEFRGARTLKDLADKVEDHLLGPTLILGSPRKGGIPKRLELDENGDIHVKRLVNGQWVSEGRVQVKVESD